MIYNEDEDNFFFFQKHHCETTEGMKDDGIEHLYAIDLYD